MTPERRDREKAHELRLYKITHYIKSVRDKHIHINEVLLSEQELQQVKLDETALCADPLASAINPKQVK